MHAIGLFSIYFLRHSDNSRFMSGKKIVETIVLVKLICDPRVIIRDVHFGQRAIFKIHDLGLIPFSLCDLKTRTRAHVQ